MAFEAILGEKFRCIETEVWGQVGNGVAHHLKKNHPE
jgi:hypothetical protein